MLNICYEGNVNCTAAKQIKNIKLQNPITKMHVSSIHNIESTNFL